MNEQFAGTEEERREKASAPILQAISRAEKEFREWQSTCHDIDDIYSLHGGGYGGARATLDSYGWQDAQLDLFWSSYEILKPAVYAKPPVPAVAPLFRDTGKLKTRTAELLERASVSVFKRTGIDDVMTSVRDDLLFTGRGVMWLRYESDDGQKVCVEHLDRADFLHEPARKWQEVGWVAGGFWLAEDEMRKRFKLSDDQVATAKFLTKRDDQGDDQSLTPKARVWEVWHRADKKVYWVTEGIDVLLDSGAPHLKLEGFFPCPRPAYGTLRRRSLVPVPDWERYAMHFRKISELTGRIYLLLDAVKMKGIVAGGGDLADAVDELVRSDDDQIVIRVPAMTTDATGLVAWLPLVEVATAIQGLISARGQLIDDFYQLSGISDIMRGATEAEETLGAQQLKSQYGSVRVRGKIDELQRVAAEAVKIAAEIIAEKFSEDVLLEMAQMEVPTAAAIKKRIKEVEDAAKAELKTLGTKAQEAATQAAQGQEQADPEQAKQMLAQAQQQILAKYAPMLSEAEGQVAIDDVMKLLRDDRARSFAFEIETDSTILTDENAEKQARNEFMAAFTNASQTMMGLAGMGEQGAALAGEMLKFTLAPYRVGRQMDSAIDAFVEAAPQMAAAQGGDDGLVEAQGKLAEAEMAKSRAMMAKVEADSALKQAENQRKMAEMQQKAQTDQAKFMGEAEKLRQSATEAEAKLAKTQAEVDHLRAQTAEILNKIGLDARKQDLTEYQAAETSETKAVEQQRTAQRDAVEDEYRERGESRADQQFNAEQQFTGDDR